MIIAQIVLDDASQYERKCQRIDAESLAAAGHVVTGDAASADVVHVYAGRTLPALKLEQPFVANVGATKRRFSVRRAGNPAAIVTPFNVSEAVEERFFASTGGDGAAAPQSKNVLGSFVRSSVQVMFEQTMHRIDRFRE